MVKTITKPNEDNVFKFVSSTLKEKYLVTHIELTKRTTTGELGLDSLDLVEFIMDLETEFCVELTISDILPNTTLATIIHLILNQP